MGTLLAVGSKMDPSLGLPQTQVGSATASPLPINGERRQVTVLYVDLVGYTAFTARAGAEHAYALMQRLSKLMVSAVHEQGCTIRTLTGDGVLALFGAPVALEDAPLRACRAALLIERRLAAATEEIVAHHGLRPQLRMSVNSGPIVFSEVADGGIGAHGDVVNLGSRLVAAADPGTILLGEPTQHLVEGMVESRFAGAFQLKGMAAPQRAYRLVGLRDDPTRFAAARRRGLTTFVGRGDELQVLEAKLRNLHGLHVVDLVGEPGIGKSRLVHEFKKGIPSDSTFVLGGGCSPHGEQTPFLPFIEVVRDYFALATGETQAVVIAKLERGLGLLGLGIPENCDLLLNLLGFSASSTLEGLDGPLIGLRTRDLLLGFIAAQCRLSPVVLLLEDLHWIDSASEEILARIIDHEALRLLLLCTRRPDYRPPWHDRSDATSLSLAPLSKQQTLQILGSRLGIGELDEMLGSIMAAKAEGNPLFAEEIASFLVEHGIVQHEASGLAYDAPAVSAALPESLQSLLAARIDRLSVADRKVLQVAAVIGRRFLAVPLASIIGASENDVAQRLSRLAVADLIYVDGGSDDYVFKHALLREALYDTLLSAQRADLHLKVAQDIERRSANRIAEVAEVLAYHYSLANAPDRALHYLCLCGQKCLDLYSLEEAEQYFRLALQTYDATTAPLDGGRMAKAVVGLLETLYLGGNVLETKSIAELYVARIEQKRALPELARVLYFLGLMHANLGAFREGEAKARRALAIAEQTRDVEAIAYARSGLFFPAIVLGQTPHEEMEAMGRQLVGECERAADNYILNWAYWSIAYYYLMRGLLVEAREWVAKLAEAGRARNDQRALGMAYWTSSWIEAQAHRYAEAEANADEALKAAVTPYDRNAANIVKAFAMVLQGRVEEGLARLRTARRWALDNGWLYSASGVDLSIAPALALVGDLRGAVKLLEAGIRAGDASGSRTIAAWNRITLAELYSGAVRTTRRPSLGFVLRNFSTVARILFVGAKTARILLEQALANTQFDRSGAICAQIELDLGLLAAHEKRIGVAREHFARAQAAAKAQGAGAIMAEIEAAIATL